MNDDELTTMMREPFASVHMTLPLDTVVHRGRTLRRRRSRGLTGAVALAGVAAVAVTVLTPGGQPPAARLAAWTVTKDSGGGISVTIRQVEDPAGLQATLRSDGVPARVTFASRDWVTKPLPAGCTAPKMSAAANAHLQKEILTPPALLAWEAKGSGTEKVTRLPDGDIETTANPIPRWLMHQPGVQGFFGGLYFNPAAIPPGIGLAVDVAGRPPFKWGVGIGVYLVIASPQCTGS
jgi:hypothetical protein